MKDNFKFLTELMKLRLSHIMTFRLGFFGPFFIDTSYFLVQLFAFEAIYGLSLIHIYILKTNKPVTASSSHSPINSILGRYVT